MAGIGIKLNRIFKKNSIAADLVGFAYSTFVTVAPMLLVILDIILMGWALGFDQVGYPEQELFSCTVLYMFIFALLTAAPLNAVLSRYMADVIFEERYQDILPCYYLGLLLNLLLSCLIGVPFCLWEHFVGGVSVFYVFTGFCGYLSMVLAVYSMIYLSVCKDYQKISLFYLTGMAVAYILSLALHYWAGMEITESMLLALTAGFFLIAALEFSFSRRFLQYNSNRYKKVIAYFGKYWQLVLTNFLYILGLYVHNFVFWSTDMRMVVAKSFVCCQPYDMASGMALFTNISATILFVSHTEMHFHEKYKAYSEAVIGGKRADIVNAQKQMFRQLADSLMNLARIQFIISVTVYLFCIVLLPQYGFSGLVLRIYPCLAAGYFILFLMYSAILFLYYFNDLAGGVWASLSFCAVTFAGSAAATRLSEQWYGIGLVLGALTGWTVTYIRLRRIEKNMEVHIFCGGDLLQRGKGRQPSGKVYEKAGETAV